MSWEPLPIDEKADVLRELQRIERIYRFNPDETLVEFLDLPFYTDARLLRVEKVNFYAQPLWYVQLPEEIVVLDGSIANIRYLDTAAPLSPAPGYETFVDQFGRSPLPDNFDFNA